MACGGADCDDFDRSRSPRLTEVCDPSNIDEDCDPTTFGDRDDDGDGFVDVACCNGDLCGEDGDDSDASVRPGATEACNGVDDDCDGSIDEGVLVRYFEDADGDGYASDDADALFVDAYMGPDVGCVEIPGCRPFVGTTCNRLACR